MIRNKASTWGNLRDALREKSDLFNFTGFEVADTENQGGRRAASLLKRFKCGLEDTVHVFIEAPSGLSSLTENL